MTPTYTAREILGALDAHAAAFEFPGFNNMHYDTADARLHLFRDERKWALLIEELVDWPGAGGLTLLAYGAGTALSFEPGLGPVAHPIQARFDQGLPESVSIRGERVSVPRSEIAVRAAQTSTSETFALLLWLIERSRDALFRNRDELTELVPYAPHLLQVDAWCHPDVYDGELPSESETFVQLAQVLTTGDTLLYRPTAAANNRDWPRWLAK